jgi:hypothetical protein
VQELGIAAKKKRPEFLGIQGKNRGTERKRNILAEDSS